MQLPHAGRVGGLGQQQFADQLIVGHVGGEPEREPGLEPGGQGADLLIIGRPAEQCSPPEVGKVCGAGSFLQQRFDQLGTLVGIRIVKKRAGLTDRWNLADQVEADSAEEFGIVGRGGRLDAVLAASSCAK